MAPEPYTVRMECDDGTTYLHEGTNGGASWYRRAHVVTWSSFRTYQDAADAARQLQANPTVRRVWIETDTRA